MSSVQREISKLRPPDIIRVLESSLPNLEPSQIHSRRAAVAMILREDGPAGVHTLFIKRAHHPLDPWSGHMAFPGGHQDKGDETLEHAVCRETLEEVGIELNPDMRIGRLDDLSGGRLGRFNMSVSPFIYLFPHEPKIVLDTSEVEDAVWVPLSYLGEPGNVRPYFYPLDPFRRPFPSFPYMDRYTIWGMTYRMIANFLRLFDVKIPLEGELTETE